MIGNLWRDYGIILFMLKKGPLHLNQMLPGAARFAAAVLVGIPLFSGCTPSSSADPTLSPIFAQAAMTQEAYQGVPTISQPQVFLPVPSLASAPFQLASNYRGGPILPKTSQPASTLAPTSTPTASLTSTGTSTPYSLPTQLPLTLEHYIKMSGHHQFFEIGCETSAAVDWAQFYGKQLTQYDFQYKLPRSDNPDFGFVGNVNDPWGQTPPFSYGVYAGPVASLLNAYGLPARAIKNGDLNLVRDQLAHDNPVIVWVIGNMVNGIPAEYTDKIGRKTIVAAYEHVVILTGYNENTQRIRYLNNGHFFEIPYATFLNSWKVLGNMALIRG